MSNHPQQQSQQQQSQQQRPKRQSAIEANARSVAQAAYRADVGSLCTPKYHKDTSYINACDEASRQTNRTGGYVRGSTLHYDRQYHG